MSVLLCETNDLASATSSASSKLIHGGLRYLEQFEFRLVREALAEREVLLQKAPHIIWPLRFLLPHQPGERSRWTIRAGLCLYDNLYRRKLIPGSSSVDLADVGGGETFKPQFKNGFSYWDCWVDDARLVVANARAAAENGAQIRTRTEVLTATATDGGWRAIIRDVADGAERDVLAKVIVNAAGPWADNVQCSLRGDTERLPSNGRRLRLVKGSHIVLPRVVSGSDALILQNADGRVVFVLPYEEQYSLIGTTDIDLDEKLESVAASPEETDYLLNAVGRYLRIRPRVDDVVWSYAGARALYDDDQTEASKVTRDYRLELDIHSSGAAVLTVLGGKITTYRALSEDALNKIATFFPGTGDAWTKTAKLPGGELNAESFDAFCSRISRERPALPKSLLVRLARRHGGLTSDLLGDARSAADLGRHIGHDLYEREVVYLMQHEWARSPDDILWRRTKAGLHLSRQERMRAEELLEELL